MGWFEDFEGFEDLREGWFEGSEEFEDFWVYGLKELEEFEDFGGGLPPKIFKLFKLFKQHSIKQQENHNLLLEVWCPTFFGFPATPENPHIGNHTAVSDQTESW